MHILRAQLNFKRLAAMYHRGMQRLIKVRPRHGDVIFEASRNGRPYLMNHAKSRVAVFYRVGNHSHCQEIENLVQGALLLLYFEMQRVKPLHAGLHLGGNSVFDEFVANRSLNIMQEFIEDFLLRGQLLLQLEISFRLQIAERKVFELASNQAHT